MSEDDRVAIYNEYCSDYGSSEDELHNFNEEFFETYFQSRMEICRATYFGEIRSWYDEYIRLNVYGNLESFSTTEAMDMIEDFLEDIDEYEDIWRDYMD